MIDNRCASPNRPGGWQGGHFEELSLLGVGAAVVVSAPEKELSSPSSPRSILSSSASKAASRRLFSSGVGEGGGGPLLRRRPERPVQRIDFLAFSASTSVMRARSPAFSSSDSALLRSQSTRAPSARPRSSSLSKRRWASQIQIVNRKRRDEV